MPLPRVRFSLGTVLIGVAVAAVLIKGLVALPDRDILERSWQLFLVCASFLAWYAWDQTWGRRYRSKSHAWLAQYWWDRADEARLDRIEAAYAGDVEGVEVLGLVVDISRDRAEWHAEQCRGLGGSPDEEVDEGEPLGLI
jgi:hypothetical protein